MIPYCLALMQQLKVDRRGITALEYGIIGVTVAAALVPVFSDLYTAVSDLLTSIAASL